MISAPLLSICVTGPESTGKTTLAARLAQTLATECVPEASRIYAERVARELTVDDVSSIAMEHIALADAAAARVQARAGLVLVLDTDLISTIVYAAHYYGFASEWLEQEALRRKADLYLLCDVDVPWTPDGIRDRPDNRSEMLVRFHDQLAMRSARVVTVSGDWETRWAIAVTAARLVAGT